MARPRIGKEESRPIPIRFSGEQVQYLREYAGKRPLARVIRDAALSWIRAVRAGVIIIGDVAPVRRAAQTKDPEVLLGMFAAVLDISPQELVRRLAPVVQREAESHKRIAKHPTKSKSSKRH